MDHVVYKMYRIFNGILGIRARKSWLNVGGPGVPCPCFGGGWRCGGLGDRPIPSVACCVQRGCCIMVGMHWVGAPGWWVVWGAGGGRRAHARPVVGVSVCDNLQVYLDLPYLVVPVICVGGGCGGGVGGGGGGGALCPALVGGRRGGGGAGGVMLVGGGGGRGVGEGGARSTSCRG